MIKYYTRACNFYYGNQAKNLIKNYKALSLCGNKRIAFDNIEIFTRENRKVKRINDESFLYINNSYIKSNAH